MDSETRITTEDIALIKAMFADNDPALKVIRKIFSPTISAADPIGKTGDLWSPMFLDLTDKNPEAALIEIKAHQKFVSYIEGGLRNLKMLAGRKDETAEATLRRLTKDSAK